jgi:mRNA interferase MazF
MMKIGTRPEQGDILLIPIPFTDLSSQKRRPVIVISNNEYNGKSGVRVDKVYTLSQSIVAKTFGRVDAGNP